jgi:hypothetical protein
MSAKKGIIVGSTFFKNKTRLKAFTNAMKRICTSGQPVEGDLAIFLRTTFQFHPDHGARVGQGAPIHLAETPNGSLSFAITGIAGEDCFMSIDKCIPSFPDGMYAEGEETADTVEVLNKQKEYEKLKPKRQSYVLGGKEFPSKQAAYREAQTLLQSSQPGQRLSGSDHDFMMDLFATHYNFEEKSGAGVDYIYVRAATMGSQCFAAMRTDGTMTDFSYKKCLGRDNPYADFAEAGRIAIKNQIDAFRDNYFRQSPPYICPISGQSMTPETCEVDHTPPMKFDLIVKTFIKTKGIDVGSAIIRGQDGVMLRQFADKSIERNFLEFHNQTASLRVVAKGGHKIVTASKLK